MVTAMEIVLEYVFPSLGMIVANLMFLAPMKDLQSVVTTGSGLGDLNPTPWAFMLGNCLGWTAYGVLISNWFVFWANFPGLLIAFWLNLGAIKLMYFSHHKDEARRSMVEYLSSSSAMKMEVAQNLEAIKLMEIAQKQSLLCENDNNKDNDGSVTDCGDTTNKDSTKTSDFGTNNVDNTSAQDQADDEIRKSVMPPRQQQYRDWEKIVREVTSQTTPAKAPQDLLVMGILIVWSLVLSGIGFAKHYYSLNNSNEDENFDIIAQSIVGYVANINLIFFYGAPLSAIGRALKSRRSDMLHFPTMVMNICNAILWTSYAIFLKDPYIYVPNGIGLIFGTIQFLLRLVFPKTKTKKPSSGDSAKEIVEDSEKTQTNIDNTSGRYNDDDNKDDDIDDFI